MASYSEKILNDPMEGEGTVGLGEQFFPMAAQQSAKESFRGALITARLNQDVDHVAVLIHGAPEILLSAVDSNENLVQVPNVAEAALPPFQFAGAGGKMTPEQNLSH